MTKWLPDITRTEGPVYLAITSAIATAVESGDLPPGTKLPTHRELAYRLGISVQTVSAGYREAERRGLVVGETGRGTFVRRVAPSGPAQFIVDRRYDNLIDMSICRPAQGYVHNEAVHQILAEMADYVNPEAMMACRPIQGLDRHRTAAVDWLSKLGMPADPGRVIVTNGAAHAIMLAVASLTDPGDVIATDRLVDHGFILLANTLHLRLLPLDSDEEGITPQAFQAACRAGGIKGLFAIPTLNNPTVTVMSAERRETLAGIARRHGVCIVEDDPYGPLVEHRPRPLSSFAPERSFYATTFTKSLMPGLRTGYLVAPQNAVPRVLSRLRATSWMATPLIAEIASQWIGDGTADRLIDWQREEMRSREKALERELRGAGCVYRRNALHAWLPVPEQWRVDAFVAGLRQRNVAVTPAELFVVGREAQPDCVRLCLGATRNRSQFEQGLRLIRETLARNPEPVFVET